MPKLPQKSVGERYDDPKPKPFADDIAPVGGNGGSLFTRPANLRADARMAARLISLGVVDEETAASLLRQGFIFAAGAAKDGNLRHYCSAMEILFSAARLEQAERHQWMNKALPDQQALTVSGQPLNPAQMWKSILTEGQEIDLEGKINEVLNGEGPIVDAVPASNGQPHNGKPHAQDSD